MNHERGFTLIELLVVIAIIGVLSSIVMSSLNTARNRGNDAKTKAQLSGLRTAMELYYDTYGNYGTVTNSCGSGAFHIEPALSYIENVPVGVSVKCVATAAPGYAASANLLSVSGSHWCIDYKGISKVQGAVQPNGDDTCN